MSSDTHRAAQWLYHYGRKYPDAWRLYAQLLEAPPETWPAWCYCPMAGAYGVAMGGEHERGSKIPAHVAADAGVLAAMAAWRPTQQIYRFHPALCDALVRTPLTGELPAEVLTRLPGWCVYIEAPHPDIWGFWAFVDVTPKTGRTDLRLVIDFRDADELAQMVVELGGRLVDGIARGLERHGDQDGLTVAQKLLPELVPLLSLVLYLCADNADVPERAALPPKVVRTKKRALCPAAKAPLVIEAGARIGAAIVRAKARYQPSSEGGTGRAMRPHVRAAHYHSFRTGPRTEPDKQKLVVHWLSPMAINVKDDEPPGPVIRPVKGGV